MSYQVLARKYRPQQFADVIAQEHVARTLQNAIKADRLSSGYLFTGPRGTGKTTTARLLAKSLNCKDGPTPTPCDKCPSCLEIISGSSLDVLEIDAASNTGVDDVRTLRENVRYLPTSGKKRIYIIDEVHRLSGSAFDALLKTLEEPPAHVVFIFATTEPHKVPETIRSRTQRYDFHRVSVNDLTSHLRRIAEAEKITIEDEALYIISRKADGSVRDGMSLLDQMSAFAGETIDKKSVTEALGLIDRQIYFDYVKALASKDSAEGLELVKNLIDGGSEISEFVSGLAGHFRNLLILKNAAEPERHLELSESEMVSFKEQVDYFTNGDLLRLIKSVINLTFDLRSGLEEGFLLESYTLQMAKMESTVLFEEILAHLSGSSDEPEDNGQERDLFGVTLPEADQATSLSAAALSTGQLKLAESESGPASTGGGLINLPVIQTGWPKFVEYLKNSNRMLSALLAMAEIKEVKGNVITAVFPSNGTNKQVVEKPDYKTVITTALREHFKANLKIVFEIDPTRKPTQPTSPTTSPEKIDSKKILSEDEKLRNIVERFNGEIVGKKKIDD
jgi:DNA polymerase-3 subunit gamma/tau